MGSSGVKLMSDFKDKLFGLKDEKYRSFNKKLLPNIKDDRIIGIRVPILRKFAKEIYKNSFKDCEDFMAKLPHFYLEENNLHAMLIEQISDYTSCIDYTNLFLPFIDNWQTCDIFSPKIFKKYPNETLSNIQKWLNSKYEYSIRFAIGLLLTNFLKDNFDKKYFSWICDVKSDEYYVKMMIAWYFCEALFYRYEFAIEILIDNKLPIWTHNQTINKALQSFKFTQEQKMFFKTLKRS